MSTVDELRAALTALHTPCHTPGAAYTEDCHGNMTWPDHAPYCTECGHVQGEMYLTQPWPCRTLQAIGEPK